MVCRIKFGKNGSVGVGLIAELEKERCQQATAVLLLVLSEVTIKIGK